MSKNNYIQTTVASAIGAFIEWYDFFIYGTCAALIFPKLFFSNLPPVVATIVSIASYSIGFVFRPLGGLIAGHFADKYGRKKVLTFTLFLMGLSTVGIGLLPTYEQIGIWAPLLLVALRIFQGFAIGGEWGAAAVMIYEHAPYNLKAFFGSAIQVGVPLAVLSATVFFALLSAQLSPEDLYAWGWRLPFLMSIVIVGVGSYIRRHLKEPAEFEQAAKRITGRAPVKEVFANHKALILRIAGMRMLQNLLFTCFTVYSLSYVTSILGLPKEAALNGVAIGSAVAIVAIPLIGLAADIFGRKVLFNIGAVASIVMVLPGLNVMAQGGIMLILVYVLGLLFHDLMFAQQAALIPESFPVEVRVTGSNVSYGLGAAFAGSLMPTLPFLESQFGVYGIAGMIITIGLISLFCANSKTIGDKNHL